VDNNNIYLLQLGCYPVAVVILSGGSDKFHCDKTNVLKISMKYTTMKSDREPLTQCNKQGSILYMYMTHTCTFLYIQ